MELGILTALAGIYSIVFNVNMAERRDDVEILKEEAPQELPVSEEWAKEVSAENGIWATFCGYWA